MIVYLRGTVLSVTEPEIIGSQGTKIQHVVVQHSWNDNAKYNKYACVDILGEERIKNMAIKPQEEVELAIDINARMGNAGRWFNSITAFSVERDKKNFHFYENNKQRVAVVPSLTPNPGLTPNPSPVGEGNGKPEGEGDDEVPF